MLSIIMVAYDAYIIVGIFYDFFANKCCYAVYKAILYVNYK